MHETARADVHEPLDALADELTAVWSISSKTRVLARSPVRFEYRPERMCPADAA
jgi:hypothetical protein